MSEIGDRLRGVSAALQGRSLEHRQQQMQQRQMLSAEREGAFAADVRALRRHLEAGNLDAGKALLQSRVQQLTRVDPNADMRDTQQAMQLIDTDPEALGVMVQSLDDHFTSKDLLTPYDTDVKTRNKREEIDLRRQELQLKRDVEQRQREKLPAGVQKILDSTQDRVVEAQRSSNEFELLATDFERENIQGGAMAAFDEMTKRFFGTEDAVSEFRRKFKAVRISEGLKNLPPGPATDQDVKEAMKGVPAENASPEQVAMFLRGAAKIARADAAYAQFKADFISNRKNTAGLNRAWRQKFKSPTLGKAVTMGEIYLTAQNRNKTPDEVAERLGVKLP